MDQKKITDLDDNELDQVTGGAINVFDAPSQKEDYWKYTCRTCGEVAITVGKVDCCVTCKSTDIHSEIYLAANA